MFVSVIAHGGPRLEPLSETKLVYTGDPVRPRVSLRYENGSAPHADVTVDIEAPEAAVGEIVASAGLAPPDLSGDPLSRFHNDTEAARRRTAVPLADAGRQRDPLRRRRAWRRRNGARRHLRRRVP